MIEHLFSFNTTLGTRHVVGPVGDGIRLNVTITGGEVTGPKIQGQPLPVGGDWLTVRRDGMAGFVAHLGEVLTDQQMADIAGVSRRTITSWKRRPEWPRSESGLVTRARFLRHLLFAGSKSV